ncbi:hypothetical protein DUI70_3936 [Streptomyces albus]|nr:hypothetical protein SLNHY_4006 [Streptomyces albus]AYN34436.1 hypothetical protein DUI70_3936 [Streptomyces albus]
MQFPNGYDTRPVHPDPGHAGPTGRTGRPTTTHGVQPTTTTRGVHR